jgi:hypothetical protein
MLSRLKAEGECGALRKWLRQYHFLIIGGMLTGMLILTVYPILVDDWGLKSTNFLTLLDSSCSTTPARQFVGKTRWVFPTNCRAGVLKNGSIVVPPTGWELGLE